MQGFGLPQHPGQGYPGPAFPGAAPGFPGMGALPDPGASLGQPGLPQPGMGADPAQLQQLVQLLGAKMLPKQTAVVECPKSMVGRVIGKGGETIKSLQQYTGAMIQVGAAGTLGPHLSQPAGWVVSRGPQLRRRPELPNRRCTNPAPNLTYRLLTLSLPLLCASPLQIDQSTDPTRVTIAGSPQSLQLAVSMVSEAWAGGVGGLGDGGALGRVAAPSAIVLALLLAVSGGP